MGVDIKFCFYCKLELANQFDVVCVHGQSLTLIECKSGVGPATARDLIEEMGGVQARFKAVRIKSGLVSTWDCLNVASQRSGTASSSTGRLWDSSMRLLDRTVLSGSAKISTMKRKAPRCWQPDSNKA